MSNSAKPHPERDPAGQAAVMLEGPFSGADALTAGLLTRHQLYGPRFCRVFPDVYLPAGHPTDLVTRSRCAALWARDRGGLLVGYSAAALLGVDCAPLDVPAEVATDVRCVSHPGLRVRRDRFDDQDLTTVGECRLTTPFRTAWDLARRLPLVERWCRSTRWPGAVASPRTHCWEGGSPSPARGAAGGWTRSCG